MLTLTAFKEIGPYLSHPLALVGFVLLLLFGVHRALIRSGDLKPIPEYEGPRILRLLLRYGFWLALLVVVLGFGLQYSRDQQRSRYHIRVTVLDAQGFPVDDATIHSPRGEVQKVASGWEIALPVASKPEDGELVVRASKPEAFLKGESTVELGKDFQPSVTIRLEPLPPDTVHGTVVDASGRSISGARVWIAEHEESVVTGPDGQFELPAHAAEGQSVRLRATKDGLEADLWHPAGKAPATLVLRPPESQ